MCFRGSASPLPRGKISGRRSPSTPGRQPWVIRVMRRWA